MRLRREVDDRVAPIDGVGDGERILDRSVDEPNAIEDVLEVFLSAGIRELVQDGDRVALIAQAQPDERRADEAGATADEQPHDTGTRRAINSSSPRRQSGSRGAPARSERNTL